MCSATETVEARGAHLVGVVIALTAAAAAVRAAPYRAGSNGRAAPGAIFGRALVDHEAPGQSPICWPPAGPGLVGRWGPADRPCGICGLPGLWPLGRCQAGRVIPSVGGVPGLPALPIEGTRDDRGREP